RRIVFAAGLSPGVEVVRRRAHVPVWRAEIPLVQAQDQPISAGADGRGRGIPLAWPGCHYLRRNGADCLEEGLQTHRRFMDSGKQHDDEPHHRAPGRSALQNLPDLRKSAVTGLTSPTLHMNLSPALAQVTAARSRRSGWSAPK